MGHSTGGLLTYMVADRGLSAASVAIAPGPFRGVLPSPLSALKSASPVLRNPLNRGRAITLTFEQFNYGWTNALDDEKEARQLYDTYHVAAPGAVVMEIATVNLNPFTEAKVDPRSPDRGPLLIIEGDSGWREVAQTALDFVKRFVELRFRVKAEAERRRGVGCLSCRPPARHDPAS